MHGNKDKSTTRVDFIAICASNALPMLKLRRFDCLRTCCRINQKVPNHKSSRFTLDERLMRVSLALSTVRDRVGRRTLTPLRPLRPWRAHLIEQVKLSIERPPLALPIAIEMSFAICSPSMGQVCKVNLIRLGAVTHGFDMDQRFVPLESFQTGFQVQINAPEDGSIAPPGYYMLFLVSNEGVPSEAAIVKLKHPPLP